MVMEEKWLKNLVRMIEQFVQGCGTEEVEYEGGREKATCCTMVRSPEGEEVAAYVARTYQGGRRRKGKHEGRNEKR